MKIAIRTLVVVLSAWGSARAAVSPNAFETGSDSDRIEAAVARAVESGERSVEIPRLNARRGQPLWLIERAILVPSVFTLVLRDCRIQLAPGTQDNLIRGMLAAGTDFRGSRCILRRVFPDHLDETGSDIVLLDGYIQDWSYVPGKKGIAFTVSKTLIDVGAQFPKRLMNMGCSHVFKGARCRYLGEEGRCLKTRAFCTSLGNINQFGGFPWVAARQRRVMWK